MLTIVRVLGWSASRYTEHPESFMSIAMEKPPHRDRITVDEYYHMAEVGLLAPDARVELIDGVIVDMPPVGYTHSSAVNWLVKELIYAVGGQASVWCQSPVRLDKFSEPQPDIALLVPSRAVYRTRHPAPEDTLLMVEVSDSSLRYDLNTKAALYARHGIPELWVIDVVAGRMHVFRNPSDGVYREAFVPDAVDGMDIKALPGLELNLSPVLRVS
jgi:Uma2 family endonuclease